MPSNDIGFEYPYACYVEIDGVGLHTTGSDYKAMEAAIADRLRQRECVSEAYVIDTATRERVEEPPAVSDQRDTTDDSADTVSHIPVRDGPDKQVWINGVCAEKLGIDDKVHVFAHPNRSTIRVAVKADDKGIVVVQWKYPESVADAPLTPDCEPETKRLDYDADADEFVTLGTAVEFREVAEDADLRTDGGVIGTVANASPNTGQWHCPDCGAAFDDTPRRVTRGLSDRCPSCDPAIRTDGGPVSDDHDGWQPCAIDSCPHEVPVSKDICDRHDTGGGGQP